MWLLFGSFVITMLGSPFFDFFLQCILAMNFETSRFEELNCRNSQKVLTNSMKYEEIAEIYKYQNINLLLKKNCFFRQCLINLIVKRIARGSLGEIFF